MGAPNCHTPHKRGYRDRAAAKRQMWKLWESSTRADRALLHPYLCGCGQWHIGHLRKKSRRDG